MMVEIKKNDFVEVEYTGKTKDENFVFDTTSEKIAKEKGIYNPSSEYGPAIICVGQSHLLMGLDKKLEGKEIGIEYNIELSPEEAFGKKSAKLLKLVPLNSFKSSGTVPEIGMQVDIDGQFGIIKTITGGRVVVDFNHPLASKEMLYAIKVNKVITDDIEKIKTIISLTLNYPRKKMNIKIESGKATVKMLKLPEVFQKELEKRIKDTVPTIKELIFEEETPKKEEKQTLNTSK